MTETLYRDDAYLKSCTAQVVAATEQGVILDRTVFYPLGGGQPGDIGELRLVSGARLSVSDTRKGAGDEIVHIVAENATVPAVGETVEAVIDWDRRYAHMRMHTGLHLLGVVLPFGVTGGSISAIRSRLDFDMTDTVDKETVCRDLNALIEADHPVLTQWITDAELAAQPELIRTMSVKPPQGAGRVRLLNIPGVDLQPCGGTHVAHTGEIGPLRLGKVEKKGARNRRVNILFDQSD
ncbi:MAG: alanyl-tRNA editing protein [Gammaproteobacteria bacterium]|nr:alanyl-tRNA editing protein [Gammaproteobacteria bacterium]MDH3768277.1 alanyl-tRNA editing protein [Gammaproteobacteria bacterium]